MKLDNHDPILNLDTWEYRGNGILVDSPESMRTMFANEEDVRTEDTGLLQNRSSVWST